VTPQSVEMWSLLCMCFYNMLFTSNDYGTEVCQGNTWNENVYIIKYAERHLELKVVVTG
jgi:hypothetical protein